MKFDYSFIYKDLFDSLKEENLFQPETAIILGSGLGNFAEKIEILKTISSDKLPNYPRSTVEGHKGFIHFGKHENKTVLLFQGRIHFYEGLGLDKTLLPVFICKELGIKNLIVTNAAGGVNTSLSPGDLMLMNDFNSFGLKKYFAKIFGISTPEQKMSIQNYPDKNLYQKLITASQLEKIQLREGSYYWTSGPSYETPAEIRMIKSLGFDSVGMSTVQEILLASMLKIDTIGISCITNMAAGLQKTKLNHEEVIETGKSVEDKFARLIKRFVEII